MIHKIAKFTENGKVAMEINKTKVANRSTTAKISNIAKLGKIAK